MEVESTSEDAGHAAASCDAPSAPAVQVLWILNLQKCSCMYLTVNSRDMRTITPKQRRSIDLTTAIHVYKAKHECNCSQDLGQGELAPV